MRIASKPLRRAEGFYRTLVQWNDLGFRVRKGQKSHKRNSKGVCVFNRSQTHQPKRPRFARSASGQWTDGGQGHVDASECNAGGQLGMYYGM
jgi:hypothetical protein